MRARSGRPRQPMSDRGPSSLTDEPGDATAHRPGPPAVPPLELAPLRARRVMWVGVLGFRWLAYSWMVASNVLSGELIHPVPAWIALALTGVWNVWFTFRAQRHITVALWLDLAISSGLVALSGWVVAPGEALNRAERTFFATTYPGGTAVTWGAVLGWRGGLGSALVLSVAATVARPINGFPLGEFPPGEWVGLLNGVVYFLVAGLTPGLMATTLDRAAEQLQAATDAAIRARERAARLGERAALQRSIHDLVLNELALLLKRGRELAQRPMVSGSDVLELAEMAGRQEEALRALILRAPLDPPEGAASLREALEEAGRSVSDLAVTVSAVGPIWLPAPDASELAAAIRQALDNVTEHARATRVGIFAESEDGWVTVSVRDDGVGFVYDERHLGTQGKAGILKSMKGRVEALGGRMRVRTAPGLGTEVEFRVPALVDTAPQRERLRDRLRRGLKPRRTQRHQEGGGSDG